MNDKTRLVFHGWLDLSAQEQQELIEAVQNYNATGQAGRSAIFKESDLIVKRISLGPLSSGCPCCGR